MDKNAPAEKLLEAWITLTGIIKNSRITTGLLYNEAVIMNILYKSYCNDGVGIVSVKEITQKTRMLKSLVNRTVNSLQKKGFLHRCDMPGDKRVAYVRCAEEKINIFLKVHRSSLAHAENIISIIGEKDTEAFIRIVEKIENSGYSPS